MLKPETVLGRAALLVALGSLCVLACHAGGAKYPWGDAQREPIPEHADVHTLNDGYQRERSQVWVREIMRPTRANLDYAAYHANFMIADPEPETPLTVTGSPDTSHPFQGLLEAGSLTSDLSKTTLSPEERKAPMAFAPLSELMQARKVAGGHVLAQLGSAAARGKTG